VVKQGARWRIGSGVNIPFLGAHWLNDGLSLSTTNPIFEPLMQVKLSEFIDQELKILKAPLIHNLFDAHTAQLILNTPLEPLVTEDKMIWKEEKSDKYSVKSAYRICVVEIADKSHMHVHGLWNLIWKLKVPPKIKIVYWRVCRGCFPTHTHLSSRGVSCPLDCVQCNNNYEDSIHILIECPKVVQVWRDANLWDTIDSDSLFCRIFLQRNVNLWPRLCGVFGRAGT